MTSLEEQATQHLRTAQSIAVHTGAGISAENGWNRTAIPSAGAASSGTGCMANVHLPSGGLWLT